MYGFTINIKMFIKILFPQNELKKILLPSYNPIISIDSINWNAWAGKRI